MEITNNLLQARAHRMIAKGSRELAEHPDRSGVALDMKLFEIALATLAANPVVWAVNGSMFTDLRAAEVCAKAYKAPITALCHLPEIK